MHPQLTPFTFTTKSAVFQRALDNCRKVAASNVNVLLSGESGSGKEILAMYIHAHSPRAGAPFVPVNCSAFTESLLESELFGHEQGAFTGASSMKRGKFEMADKGTLFLDEVGDLDALTQLKLLRTIETKKTERIGSNVQRSIDFRLISATHQDMHEGILQDRIREDFFYRISTIVIRVPSLSERPEDLPALIDFFIDKTAKEHGIPIQGIDPEPLEFLHAYTYPGNIRELKSIIERMVVLSENHIITREGIPQMFAYSKKDLKKDSGASPTTLCFNEMMPFRAYKQKAEAAYLGWVLSQTGGNVTAAAKLLEITPRQLFNKIRELGLKR